MYVYQVYLNKFKHPSSFFLSTKPWKVQVKPLQGRDSRFLVWWEESNCLLEIEYLPTSAHALLDWCPFLVSYLGFNLP